MLVDLQLHSNYSDGVLSPNQIAKLLKSYKIKFASLTDHNSVSGQKKFKKACHKLGIKTVYGLELYVKYKSYNFNILWYNYDIDSLKLEKLLKSTWQRRRRKLEQSLEPLYKKGIKIDFDKYLEKNTEYLPVNRLVDYIWQVPANRRIIRDDLEIYRPREEEIIKHYFYPKGGSKLKEARVSFERIVALKNEIGGQILIAHPALGRRVNYKLIKNLADIGLDGLEVFSPHHGYNSIVHLLSIANELNLIVSGGSDFHLAAEKGIKSKYAWDWFKIDSLYLKNINKIIK